MSRFVLAAIVFFALYVCPAWGAEPVKCTRKAAIAAETQTRPKTWAELYISYRHYVQCDDGSVAEAYSDFVGQMLAEQWETIEELNSLSKDHPSFGRFVLRHTDVTISLQQATAIKKNAESNCPVTAQTLCNRILNRMREWK